MNSFPNLPAGEQSRLNCFCAALCDILLPCSTLAYLAVLNKTGEQIRVFDFVVFFFPFIPFHFVSFRSVAFCFVLVSFPVV